MRLTDIPLLVRLHNWLCGSRVHCDGTGHRFKSGNTRLRGCTIEFYGQDGVIELGTDVRLFDCAIILRGTAPNLVIGSETRLRGVRIVVEDRGSRLEIGGSTSMTGASLQAMEGGSVRIGRDCMIGSGATISNSDVHSVIDAVTGERLNHARDVVIEDHVWIGSNARISKGAHIGTDSIIAAGSRVSGQIPSAVIAAGNPAVVKRTGINWDRRRLGITP